VSEHLEDTLNVSDILRLFYQQGWRDATRQSKAQPVGPYPIDRPFKKA